MRTRTTVILASLATAIAIASLLGSPVPGQAPPPNLPASTVYGRLGISSGPGQAIPFATLLANLFNGTPAFTAHSVLIGEGANPLNGVLVPDAQVMFGQTGADPAPQAFSGDFTCSDTGACTIGAGAVTGAKIANTTVANGNLVAGGSNTIKGSLNGTSEVDLTPGQAGGILCVPVPHVFISGTSQTFTTDTCNGVTATWLEVHVQGGGGGGSGSGTSTPAGTAGNASSFGALTANGGGAASSGTPGAPGPINTACSGSLGTQQNFPGAGGNAGTNATAQPDPGGQGGVSYYGGYGASPSPGANGNAAPSNSGGGGAGGGGSSTASTYPGAGGAAGCHIWSIITAPAATYTYTVGGAAAGGAAGTSGSAGGAGAAGLITVVAHWQ